MLPWARSRAGRIARRAEVESKQSAGHGGGQQILAHGGRKKLAIHAAGLQWTEDAVAKESPAIAGLATPYDWARVVESKRRVWRFAQKAAILTRRLAPVYRRSHGRSGKSQVLFGRDRLLVATVPSRRRKRG